ncbi:unnamed protein product [Sphagnum jensenii]|uniref:Uncharacterized protein n=1 Tax=Sphagnum jensenii TaxID=128206 RepID=A0ABP1BIJ3_9BRYO
MTCKHVPSAKKIISELLHSTKVRYSHWSNCLQGSSSSIGAILVGAVLFRIRTRSVYNFNLRTEPSSMTAILQQEIRWFDQDKNTTVAWWPLMILSGCNSGTGIAVVNQTHMLIPLQKRHTFIEGDIEHLRDIFQTVAAFFSEEKRVGPLVQELDSQTRRAFMRGQLSGLGYGLCQFHVFSAPMNL